VRLALEVLWDKELLSLEERDELMGLLDDPQRLAASAVEDATEPDPVTDVVQQAPVASPPASAEEPVTDVGRLLGRAVDIALTPSTTEAEVARQVAGLEWLIDLDPTDPSCWFPYGRLLAHLGAATGREPRGSEPRRQLLVGQLHGSVERGDAAMIVRFAAAHPDVVETLLDQAAAGDVPARLLDAHLGEPRTAARLLLMVRQPFQGWRTFMRTARAEATTLLAHGRGSDAEILLQAIEERLLRWAAGNDGDREEWHNEGVATMVLRAGCRRRRSDFTGASRLLADVDSEVLDTAGRVGAAVERALAAAEISGIEDLSFPPERSHLSGRLERARPHLGRVLEIDPAHLEANLLLGMHAYCGGDDDGAARHLGMVGARLTDTSERRPLARAVAFHRAAARLRQLEAGTDEGAYHDMVTAIDDGYVPAEAELVSAAVALEAYGSPHAADFLVRAVALSSSPIVVGLVMERARTGDTTAGGIAEDIAGDDRRRTLERFELLDAALAGAERRADPAATDRLVGLLDDIVARANQPSLDERWADVLGTAETLRAVLEPAHADALRMEVLRRSGRLDEARAIATGLYYRAAAGSLTSFDAAGLLEVLREMGLAPADLDDLARLLHDEPPPSEVELRVGPTHVLFVGGNETQERYQAQLEAEIDERYGKSVSVEWFFSGWSPNWPKVAEAIDASYRLRAPDAVVLMTFVRTNLGRWVRRTAGEHGLPWISCAGHGKASMARAIDRAVQIASEARADGNG
jgi:hypothetical protein